MINLREFFSKEFLEEYFYRNKNLILLSAIIFILSVLIGAVFSGFFKEMATELIRQMLEEIPVDSISKNVLSLFLNNITAGLTIILGGFIFSLLSVLAIFVNGILIGYVYTLINPIVYFVGIIPHGLFELPALILSLTGAFIVTKAEIILIQALFNKSLERNKEDIKLCVQDLVFTIILLIVLFFIAAIIEATITPLLLNLVI